MDLLEFDKKLKEFFDIKQKPRSYLCSLTWIASKQIVLDLIKLDDLLHERHGIYETERGMSMAELIETEYGNDARLWVQSTIA